MAAQGHFGNQILQDLIDVKTKNPSLSISIVQNAPNENFPSDDSEMLRKRGIVNEIININMKKGIQHAKFLITDDSSKFQNFGYLIPKKKNRFLFRKC